jgi:hypothetical protein
MDDSPKQAQERRTDFCEGKPKILFDLREFLIDREWQDVSSLQKVPADENLYSGPISATFISVTA